MAGSAMHGGQTAAEICAVALMKLALSEGDVVADIGCGSGRVSVAMARTAGWVYAIDRRSDAVSRTREAAAEAGAENISVIEGEAVDALADLESLDGAFVGGSRDLAAVLRELTCRVSGAVVVNAVLLETAAQAVAEMTRLGIFREAVHLQVSRAAPLAGRTIFSPLNPVTIVVGRVD